MLNSIEPLFLRDFYALINELLGAFILLEMNIRRSLYFLQFSSGPQTEISQVVPEVLKSIGGSLHLHMVSMSIIKPFMTQTGREDFQTSHFNRF